MTEPGSQFDATRAELFEALGHPIRVKILQALGTKPMGFAELKKEVGIGSSGHLEFHLRKLSGLVETTAEGSYTLTDDGTEAVRVLKSVPVGHGEAVPKARSSILRRTEWTKPLLAVFLIALITLSGVAVYQQEQISSIGHELSDATVSIGGTRYYYETIPFLPNGTSVQFHGVTFTDLVVPSTEQMYYDPSNYTYAGSVRLTNGTLLDLSGKAVMVEIANETCRAIQTINGNSTGVHYGYCDPGVGMSITFPDGSQVAHPGFNLTARHQDGYDTLYDVYVLTYSMLPPTNSPWFAQRDGITAGFFVNATTISPTFGSTLYVSVST